MSVLPVAADDLPVVSGRLYPRRTGRLSGLFIRQEAPYRLKITLTGKNQVAFRAALGSPRRFQASARPATLRMRRPAAGPSLFQIPTFFRPLHPGRSIVFRAPHVLFGRPSPSSCVPGSAFFTFGHCPALSPATAKHFPLPDAPVFRPLQSPAPQALSSPYYAEGIPGSSAPYSLHFTAFRVCYWFCCAQAELLLCLLHLAGRLSF